MKKKELKHNHSKDRHQDKRATTMKQKIMDKYSILYLTGYAAVHHTTKKPNIP